MLSLVIGMIALAGSLLLGAVAIFLAIALGGLVLIWLAVKIFRPILRRINSRKSKKEYKTKKNCVRIGFVKKARLKRHSFLLLRRAK